MGAVNRFSKPVRPAEFNPMTADDIMRVPLLKGQMEQEQLQAIEDKRLAMMNVDVAPGDMERVRAEQGRLSGEFDNLVGQITSEGVGARTSDSVNKFMRDYNDSTSKTGVIGNAAQFAADRKVRKEQDRQLAIQRGYNMQDWDKLYGAHEARQQSVDAEGNLVSEFQNINLPTHLDPKKTFRDSIKGKIGSIKEGTTLGDFTDTNRPALTAAVDQMISEYDNDPEYRQMLTDLGYSRESFIAEIANEADIALEETFVGYQQKPLTEQQKAAAKKKKDDADEANRLAIEKRSERILSAEAGPIERSDIRSSEAEIAELESNMVANRDNEETADATRLEYLKAVAKNDEVTDLFLTKGKGTVWAAEEEAARKALVTGEEAAFTGSLEQAQQVMDDKYTDPGQKGGYMSVGAGLHKQADTDDYERATIVKGENGEYHIYENTSMGLANYKDKQEQYKNKFEAFAGPNSLHSERVYHTVNSKMVGGTSDKTNTPIMKKLEGQLQDVIVGSSSSNEVAGLRGTYTDKDGNPQSIEMADNDERAKMDVENYLKTADKSKIKNMKFAMATDNRPAAVTFSYTTKQDVDGDKVEETVTYDVTLDMHGNEASEWGVFLSEGLGGIENDYMTELLKKDSERQDYSNIVPAPAARDANRWENTKEIKQTIKNGHLGKRISGDFPGVQVAYDDGGYSIRAKYKSGVHYPASTSDMMRPYRDNAHIFQTNKILWKHFQDEFFASVGINGTPTAAQAEQHAEAWSEYVEKQRHNTDPFKVGSKVKLMKILQQDGTIKPNE